MNVLLKDEKTDAVASLWSLCAFSEKISAKEFTCPNLNYFHYTTKKAYKA